MATNALAISDISENIGCCQDVDAPNLRGGAILGLISGVPARGLRGRGDNPLMGSSCRNIPINIVMYFNYYFDGYLRSPSAVLTFVGNSC